MVMMEIIENDLFRTIRKAIEYLYVNDDLEIGISTDSFGIKIYYHLGHYCWLIEDKTGFLTNGAWPACDSTNEIVKAIYQDVKKYHLTFKDLLEEGFSFIQINEILKERSETINECSKI